MKIPNGPEGSIAEGKPTLFTVRIRTYGAGGFRMASQETVQGCPAQYKARYIDKRVQAKKTSDQLLFGRLIHDTLHKMERDAIGPHEALADAWLPELPMTRWGEAVELMESYLARGGPMARYATLGVELELFAPLYVDDDFGQVFFGGYLDWLGVDLDQPQVLHMVDYKTNQFPPSKSDVEGDVQMMGYDWLVRENWQKLGLTGRPHVVAHLDAVRYRDVETKFSESQLAEWRDWAEAVARKILRDETAEEIVNPYCGWCPIKLTCGSYKRLGTSGSTMLERKAGLPLEQLLEWQSDAKNTIKVLKAGVEEVTEMTKLRAQQESSFDVDGMRYAWEPSWGNDLDKQRLVEVIGIDKYVELSAPSKKSLEALAKGDPTLQSAIDGCYARVPSGMKLAVSKVEEEGAF